MNKNIDNLIDKDIPRTFPDLNSLFEEVHSLSDSLREILIAFSAMRPDIGYTQGMAHLAGMLLMHCGPPQTCFKLFANIIVGYDTVYHFNTFNMVYIKQYYRTFWYLLKTVYPELFNELISPGDPVSASVFIFPWVLTLFT